MLLDLRGTEVRTKGRERSACREEGPRADRAGVRVAGTPWSPHPLPCSLRSHGDAGPLAVGTACIRRGVASPRSSVRVT